MAAAFDAKNTANTQTNGATTLTNSNLTIGNFANLLLIATITFPTALPTITQFQWDKLGTPQNLTAVTNASSSGANSSCALYALVAPTFGNKQLSITWTGTSEATLSCLSFKGVDQTSVSVACPHGNGANGNSNSAAVTITSASGNMVTGVFITIASGIINSTNNNNVFIDNSGTSSDAAGNYASGAASVALSAAISASGVWNAAGCDILAAGAATSPLRRNASLDGLGASGPFFSNPLARSVLGWRPSIVAVRRKLIVPLRHEERLAA